jgi:lipopolysaccharide export system protein LptC
MNKWIFLTILLVIGLFGLGWIYAGNSPNGIEVGVDRDQIQRDVEQVVETVKNPVGGRSISSAGDHTAGITIEK